MQHRHRLWRVVDVAPVPAEGPACTEPRHTHYSPAGRGLSTLVSNFQGYVKVADVTVQMGVAAQSSAEIPVVVSLSGSTTANRGAWNLGLVVGRNDIPTYTALWPPRDESQG